VRDGDVGTHAKDATMKATELVQMVRLRVQIAPGIALGPGKADLLDGIRETGSIAAAGRRMRMSYKRAWQLVDELNRLFALPLVEASKGGSGGGGATLTRTGRDVLARYRRMHAACCAAIGSDVAALYRHRSSAADSAKKNSARKRDSI
jgi:molybdate transport system regulatory protein